MTLIYENEYGSDLGMDCKSIAELVISEALDYEKCPYEVEIGVTLVSNTAIREMNDAHRKIDSPTDVLSFPMIEYEKPGDFSHLEDSAEYFNQETGELVLGDIVISLDKVKEQAEDYGHSIKREYAFLIVHSMLHLMGYDHMNKEDAAIMEAKQEEILSKLGIGRD